MDSASSNTVDRVRCRHFSASLARAASTWRTLHRQTVAETAHGPLGRVIWRISAVCNAATHRRHLKYVTALLLAHYRYGGARCVNHAVEARVHNRLEVLSAHLLERRNLPISGVIDEYVQTPERVHR